MIEFDHVSMSYQNGAPLALKDVSFSIKEGEFVFVIGRSGSGKSTTVKLLTCETKPNQGNIYIGDYCLNRLKRRWVPYLRRNIGMVFQDFRLISTKTIFENIAFPLEIQGYSRRAIRRQVSMVLSTVGLRNREHAFPHELSGGEQQRVAIARAMVINPSVLLADEPTGNLDPINSETIMALLEEINRMGTTVVVCTHDKEMVNRMKKRVIVIDQGEVVRDDDQTYDSMGASPIRHNQGQGVNITGATTNKQDLDAMLAAAASEQDAAVLTLAEPLDEIAEDRLRKQLDQEADEHVVFDELPAPEAVEALYEPEDPMIEPIDGEAVVQDESSVSTKANAPYPVVEPVLGNDRLVVDAPIQIETTETELLQVVDISDTDEIDAEDAVQVSRVNTPNYKAASLHLVDLEKSKDVGHASNHSANS